MGLICDRGWKPPVTRPRSCAERSGPLSAPSRICTLSLYSAFCQPARKMEVFYVEISSQRWQSGPSSNRS